MGRVVEKIFIPIRLPALNELIGSAKCVRLNRRGRFYRYHTVKEKYEDQIIAHLLANPPAKRGLSGVKLKFIWHEPDRRRDPDNISSGGRKILLDALTKAGVLEGDGWRHILGFENVFVVDKKMSGVEVRFVKK